MRSFDERRAEIFRRSAEIRRRSRNRRRLAAFCVPLLLCLAVYAATALPHERPAVAPMPESGSPPASSEVSAAYVAAELRRLGEGAESPQTIEDPETLAQLCRALKALDDEQPETTEPADDLLDGSLSKEETDRADGYVITLTAPDGEKIVYTLVGHQLTGASQRVYLLTDAQLAEWRQLLGLNQ